MWYSELNARRMDAGEEMFTTKTMLIGLMKFSAESIRQLTQSSREIKEDWEKSRKRRELRYILSGEVINLRDEKTRCTLPASESKFHGRPESISFPNNGRIRTSLTRAGWRNTYGLYLTNTVSDKKIEHDRYTNKQEWKGAKKKK